MFFQKLYTRQTRLEQPTPKLDCGVDTNRVRHGMGAWHGRWRRPRWRRVSDQSQKSHKLPVSSLNLRPQALTSRICSLQNLLLGALPSRPLRPITAVSLLYLHLVGERRWMGSACVG